LVLASGQAAEQALKQLVLCATLRQE